MLVGQMIIRNAVHRVAGSTPHTKTVLVRSGPTQLGVDGMSLVGQDIGVELCQTCRVRTCFFQQIEIMDKNMG